MRGAVGVEPGVDKVDDDTVLDDEEPLRAAEVVDDVEDWRGVCFGLLC